MDSHPADLRWPATEKQFTARRLSVVRRHIWRAMLLAQSSSFKSSLRQGIINSRAALCDMAKENIKLLTVEDTFFIEGRGVMVLPMITNYSGPTSFSVVLRKPNGEEPEARANLDIPTLNLPREPYPFVCSFAGMNKQEIPIGTEVWISPEITA